jgi:DNA-binding NarL/FixJ family response regulator
MSAEKSLRVVVADDDPFARRLITGALRKAGMNVVGEAANGREAVELGLYHRPDVVLMDVVMPSLDGILATRMIVKANPEQLVVVLTGADEEEFGLLALRVGAVGFLSKDVDIDALPRALMGAWAGEGLISREMTRRLIARVRKTPDGSSGLRPIRSPLTAREWEVIDLLDSGSSTDEVADALVVSFETVRSHVKNILRKLEVHSRGEAMAVARQLRNEGLETIE